MTAPAPARRLIDGLRSLPSGIGAIGAGLIVLGITSYGFLAISARAVGPTRYAGISVLWAVVLLIGPGVFFPLEQELARSISSRLTAGLGIGPVVKRTAEVGLAMLTVLVIAIVVGGPTIRRELFDGNTLLLVGMFVALTASYLQHIARGTLLGCSRYGAYGLLAGIEGTARLAGCIVLAEAGVTRPGPYGIVIGLGTLLSTLPGLVVWKQARTPGPGALRSEVFASIGVLVASSVLSGLLVNLGPVLVKVYAKPGQEALVSSFLACAVIARIPLFLFGAVEAAALPRLSSLASAGEKSEYVVVATRLIGMVAAVAAAATLGAGLLGPFAVRILYGESFVLGRGHLAALAGASGLLIVAFMINGALISVGRQQRGAVAWCGGALAFLLFTAVPGTPLVRVERALVVGTATVVGLMVAMLVSVVRGWADGTPLRVGSVVAPMAMEP